MFEDDRGRLEQIGESLELIRQVLDMPEGRTDDVVWYRLGRIHQSWSRLTAGYRGNHPEIEALGLPTFDDVLSDLPPPRAQFADLAERTVAAFAPLLAAPPPPPALRANNPNPNSRFDQVFRTLQRLEPEFCGQGISALYLFGSIARREDHEISDVDVAFEIAPEKAMSFSLIDQTRMNEDLRKALGSPVDFVELKTLHKEIRERVDRDLVCIWAPCPPQFD